MSILTDALELIGAWLCQNPSATVSLYNIQIGLTRQQITELTRELPFSLSEEVCEFYQWSNGGLSLNFNVEYVDDDNEVYQVAWEYGFFSLEHAREQMDTINKSDCRLMTIGWRQCDAGADCIDVVLGEDASPVLYFNDNRNYYPDLSKEELINRFGRFGSLTEMIVNLSDCCESAHKYESLGGRVYYQVSARRFWQLLH